MGSNFTMRFLENGREKCIELKGDFDGSAACILADALRRNAAPGRCVTVDTTGLRTVHPFGREVFRGVLRRIEKAEIRFTGPYGKDLRHAAPIEGLKGEAATFLGKGREILPVEGFDGYSEP